MTVSPLVGLALLPLGIGLTALVNGVARWRRWRVGPDWLKTSATVRSAFSASATVLAGHGGRSVPYRYPHIEYAYIVEGQTYVAVLQQALVGPRIRREGYQYRPGMSLDVFYDPRAPERSVPVGHVEWSASVSLAVGSAFLLAGGWLLWRGVRP
jgi:hypothetical protein